MTDQEIFKTGSSPGKGRYVCADCKEDLVLDEDSDRLPPCAKCHKTDFIREDAQPEQAENPEPEKEKKPEKKEKKPKPAKDMIKVMAKESGRFASNRDGTHVEVTLNKGENIITKAQYEICKDAPDIKKM